MPTALDQMPHMPSQMDVGSGIDTRKMVQDLVQAERAPTEKRLANREEEIQEKISALGQMQSTISEFREGISGLADPGAYSGIEVDSSNSSAVQASAEEGAPAGSHDVQVEQLARGQRIATASGAFEDSSDPLGTGRMIIADGRGQEQVVRIDEDQATLLGIRDAINEQTEGLRASVVDDGAGPRLAISTEETGQQNAIQQIRTEQGEEDEGDLSLLQFGVAAEGQQAVGAFEQVQAATDAVATIDGMQVTRPSNTIEGAIDGVTLELGEEGRSRVTVRQQTGLAEENIQRLVDSYNQVRSQLNQLSAYDPESEKAAPLQGDSTLSNVESRLSRAITEPVGELAGQPLRALGDLGIRTNRDGTLDLDGAQMQSMAAEHPELLTELMTNPEGGVMARLESVLEEVVGRDGVISMRTDGLESRLERIDDDRQRLDRRMERREEQLRSQFSRMDQRVAELNQTSEFIKQRLDAMNKN
ncbi:flagellar filament capping protein FliD [Halorhodospira halochloris]|uniref:flagellar filament capping protein FliD n=1 Tax=Halorhodospira halochloris TaxID=1052 RepID=UPI001EE795AE|nr:flagellar filament capping protein FliD [Halorhodospira halochloris]MCG5530003.1 flagellar filament capping protein FliD [Halorhodospira halochloris]